MIRPMPDRPIGLTEPSRARGLPVMVVAAGLLLGAPAGRAADLYSGDGFDLRWDNTLRYSAAARLGSADPMLLSRLNADDGDRNFAPGLISNRLDLLSVVDLSKDDFGVQASVEAWYDTVYHAHTDNHSPWTSNAASVPATQFVRAVRNLQGQDADLGDTFVYGNFAVGGMPVSMRVGRQSVLWGESLFFDESSIAAAQAPVDYIKNADMPEGYSNDAFLPVDQIALSVQPRAGITLAAYYQFGWRGSRLAGVGSYFSDTDLVGVGAERVLLPWGKFLHHGKDATPQGDDQFGVSLHATVDDLDLGLYALKYDDKYPIFNVVSYLPPSSAPADEGEFNSVYPKGIELYGASFSTYLGGSNVAGEVSVRRNTPLTTLVSIQQYLTEPVDTGTYARGDQFHAQLSSVTTLAPAAAWDSADLSVEVAANDLLDLTWNKAAVDPSRLGFASTIRVLFQPRYFEILPHLDISLPLGIGYSLSGRSYVGYSPSSGAGDFEAGLSATYLSVWKADLTVTSFLGPPSRQPLTDRGFIALSLERTF